MRRSSAISAIQKHGILLVFPIDNAAEPRSLWSVAFPRTKMRWEWDDNGDGRVARLWHLREELSRSDEVIYTKWYRGRATFFSRPVFTAMLARFQALSRDARFLSKEAREILDVLEVDSPLSTKQLKRACGLQGRGSESIYTRALKELWSNLLIVGYGEVDEGAFPSLAIGATRVLFEELYKDALSLNLDEIATCLEPVFKSTPRIKKFYDRLLEQKQSQKAPTSRVPKGYIEYNG